MLIKILNLNSQAKKKCWFAHAMKPPGGSVPWHPQIFRRSMVKVSTCLSRPFVKCCLYTIPLVAVVGQTKVFFFFRNPFSKEGCPWGKGFLFWANAVLWLGPLRLKMIHSKHEITAKEFYFNSAICIFYDILL